MTLSAGEFEPLSGLAISVTVCRLLTTTEEDVELLCEFEGILSRRCTSRPI